MSVDKATRKWWLYALKLEEGRVYVGITTDVDKRFQQHKAGIAGIAWTKKYKPLKVEFKKDLGTITTEKAQEYEGKLIRKYMEHYGDDSTRGGDLIDLGDVSHDKPLNTSTKRSKIIIPALAILAGLELLVIIFFVIYTFMIAPSLQTIVTQ